MNTMDEITGEIKQKTQGAIQFLQQAEHLFEYFAKLAKSDDVVGDNLISQALDSGELSSFNFTGQLTDLSYFSQSNTMPLSAIRNIGDENIKEGVKQNFDKAAQQGLIELDGENIKITAKGKEYISQPDFIKVAQADQTAAYKKSVENMANASSAENEVQMCVAMRGNFLLALQRSSCSLKKSLRLALCGSSDVALEAFLERHSEVRVLHFRLDNDEAGRAAAQKYTAKYQTRGYEVHCIFSKGKDVNEDLLHKINNTAKTRR